jgi:effector-binding domain-containing protein
MDKMKRCFLAAVGIGVIFMCLAACAAKEEGATKEIKIKKYKKQVVIYTIFRGDYKKIGPVMQKLYFLASNKGMNILGTPTYVYLNNPNQISSKHWLTEIRLEVNKEALEQAGTLGQMTDVKEVPGYEAAVAIKMPGVADTGPIYDKLLFWIIEQGYIPAGAPIENFLIGSANSEYSKVKSEITMPVMKLSKEKKSDKADGIKG